MVILMTVMKYNDWDISLDDWFKGDLNFNFGLMLILENKMMHNIFQVATNPSWKMLKR